MNALKIVMLSLIAIGLIFSVAFAMKHLPEERGKTLFNDPKFTGGKKACNECHPNGKGLEDVADKLAKKEELKVPGKKLKTLEEAVNFCIVNGNQGKAIDIKSDQMKDIIAYIMSLKPKTPAETPKQKAPGY